MAAYVARRFLQAILILIGVTLVAFFLLYVIPADPAQMMVGRAVAGPGQIAAVRHQLGLDLPFFERYFHYLGNLAQGNLGRSYLQKTEVSALIWSRLPATLLLIAGAIFFEIVIGLTMGLLAAIWRNGRIPGARDVVECLTKPGAVVGAATVGVVLSSVAGVSVSGRARVRVLGSGAGVGPALVVAGDP